MALITTRCSSRGATVIFTINDVTLRATHVQWIVVSNALRILIFDNLGNIALDIDTGEEVSPLAVDLEVREVQITKSDLSTRTYISARFAVYF